MYRSVSCMMEYLLSHAMRHSLWRLKWERRALNCKSIARVKMICIVDILRSVESNVAFDVDGYSEQLFGVELPHHGIHDKEAAIISFNTCTYRGGSRHAPAALNVMFAIVFAVSACT